ncbi:tripeptidyl-peptidase [Podospora fimiseda]|uniref:tripeptidyl-peptidase II n=1 Tax=Podospora fimiseda TaxID=252190 RepID=A0AAN7BPB5_9PEZI|nr:tripeptidyl-peptidase [Podospora fimiseda]
MWRTLLLTLLGIYAVSVRAGIGVILQDAKLEGIPSGWEVQRNASASDKITLHLSLKNTGVDELKSNLHQRQSPRNFQYRQHMTRDQIRNYLQPKQQTTDTVTTWLKSKGIQTFKTQGGLISFEASAKTIKDLFQADLKYYSYSDSSNTKTTPILRARSYNIPSPLRKYIDFIHPLTNFMPPPRHRPPTPKHKPKPKPKPKPSFPWYHPPPPPNTQPTTSSPEEEYEPNLPCLLTTTPSCIRQLYNLSYTPTTPGPSPVRFAIAGFLDQFIHQSDVSLFLSQYTGNPAINLPSLPSNFSLLLLNSATNPQSPPSLAGIEASLDMQYALALGHPTNISYILTAGRGVKLSPETLTPITEGDNEPYFEFLTYLLSLPDDEIPHVLSISYADDEFSVPKEYALKVCDLFAALTARGTTILVASGDGGAAGTGKTSCQVEGKKGLVPTFPASCPYVTAVGSVDNIAPPIKAEGFSAGGFSNYFAVPDYQKEAVKSISSGAEDKKGLFREDGRAIPDISAIGSNFQIIMGGEMDEVMGTSASAPVIAAMIALINDKRMREGKKGPLGWLNPLLYGERVKKVLKDVVEGESYGYVGGPVMVVSVGVVPLVKLVSVTEEHPPTVFVTSTVAYKVVVAQKVAVAWHPLPVVVVLVLVVEDLVVVEVVDVEDLVVTPPGTPHSSRD